MINSTFVGRITKDPVVREVQDKIGKKHTVCNFFIAADDGFGDYKKTEFVRVTLWDHMANAFGQYMHKGREVAVKGAVHLYSYDSKDAAGAKKTFWCLSIPRVENLEYLGSSTRAGVTETQGAPEIVPTEATPEQAGDELPW